MRRGLLQGKLAPVPKVQLVYDSGCNAQVVGLS